MKEASDILNSTCRETWDLSLNLHVFKSWAARHVEQNWCCQDELRTSARKLFNVIFVVTAAPFRIIPILLVYGKYIIFEAPESL